MMGFYAVTIINILCEQTHEHYQLRSLNLERHVNNYSSVWSSKMNDGREIDITISKFKNL